MILWVNTYDKTQQAVSFTNVKFIICQPCSNKVVFKNPCLDDKLDEWFPKTSWKIGIMKNCTRISYIRTKISLS